MTAKIDILLPCRNSSATMARTIDSILCQSFTDYRVVLVDNNSSDNSVDIYKKTLDNRFEYRCHKQSVSLGANFNRCLDYVDADYFCIMHADDEYYPDYLKLMYEAMQKNPDVSVAFCNVDIIDAASQVKTSLKNMIKKRASSCDYSKYMGCQGLQWISDYNKIIAPSVIYRKDVICRVGLFNTDLKFTLDWDYWYRSLKSGICLMHVSDVLFKYRIHGKQQTAILISSMEKYYEMYAFLGGIYKTLEEQCGGVRSVKYKYLRYSIISDLLADCFGFRYVSALQKYRYLMSLRNINCSNRT